MKSLSKIFHAKSSPTTSPQSTSLPRLTATFTSSPSSPPAWRLNPDVIKYIVQFLEQPRDFLNLMLVSKHHHHCVQSFSSMMIAMMTKNEYHFAIKSKSWKLEVFPHLNGYTKLHGRYQLFEWNWRYDEEDVYQKFYIGKNRRVFDFASDAKRDKTLQDPDVIHDIDDDIKFMMAHGELTTIIDYRHGDEIKKIIIEKVPRLSKSITWCEDGFKSKKIHIYKNGRTLTSYKDAEKYTHERVYADRIYPTADPVYKAESSEDEDESTWDTHSMLQHTLSWVGDLKSGEENYYDHNGNLAEISMWKKGEQLSKVNVTTTDKKQIYKTETVVYGYGGKSGFQETYFQPDFSKASEGPILQGLRESYVPTNKRHVEHDKKQTWNEAGILIQEETYENGDLNGWEIKYDEKGKTTEKVRWKRGAMIKTVYADGTVIKHKQNLYGNIMPIMNQDEYGYPYYQPNNDVGPPVPDGQWI